MVDGGRFVEEESIATLIIQDQKGTRGWVCSDHESATCLLERYCVEHWDVVDPKSESIPEMLSDVIDRFFKLSGLQHKAFIVNSTGGMVHLDDVEFVPF